MLLVVACTAGAPDGEADFLEAASRAAPSFARDASDADLLELGRRLCASADENGEGEVIALGSGRFVGQDETTGVWQAALDHMCPQKRPAQ